jgi:hypothetical protein
MNVIVISLSIYTFRTKLNKMNSLFHSHNSVFYPIVKYLQNKISLFLTLIIENTPEITIKNIYNI